MLNYFTPPSPNAKENCVFKQKGAFTLIEQLLVIIVLGILAILAITHTSTIKEQTLDKEAIVNLKMLRSAEISYNMDNDNYYPQLPTVSESNIANINANLKVALRLGPWNYTVWNNGCSRATRNGADGRSWYLLVTDDGEPDAGAGCP